MYEKTFTEGTGQENVPDAAEALDERESLGKLLLGNSVREAGMGFDLSLQHVHLVLLEVHHRQAATPRTAK